MQKLFLFTGLFFIVALRVFADQSEAENVPKSIPYNGMAEVSGVAATNNGYFLVGDGTFDRIHVIGNDNIILDTRFEGFESIDVVFADGREVALILSEDDRTLFEAKFTQAGLESIAHHTFEANLWAENCGRGLEGLAVKKTSKEGILRVAVLWEGGYAQIANRGKESCPFNTTANNLHYPRIGVFDWQVGKGLISPIYKYEVATPIPGAVNNVNIHQRFRATDLVWHQNALLVLMGTTHIGGIAPYKNTWLQSYCPNKEFAYPNGAPEKLYAPDDDVDVLKGRNWEAMDWDHDNRHLVLGFDNGGSDERGALSIISPAASHNTSCEKRWILE